MIGNTWFVARHSRCQAAVVRRLFAIFLRVRDTCLGYMVFVYKALETEVDCQRSESCGPGAKKPHQSHVVSR